MNTRLSIRIGITLAVLLPFVAYTAGYLNWPFLGRLENLAYDARLRLTMPETIDSQVVVVDIDERSLATEGQWPWPRGRLAELTDRLFETYQIRALGFDILFAEADRSAELSLLDQLAESPAARESGFSDELERMRFELDQDRIFAESLRDRPTVLGYVFRSRLAEDEPVALGILPQPLLKPGQHNTHISFDEPDGYTGILPALASAATAGGFIENDTFDSNGVVRRVAVLRRYDDALYESFALALTRVALGEPELGFEFYHGDDGPKDGLDLEWLRLDGYQIPVDENVTALVPYRGGHYSFPYVSATDVLNGNADAGVLSDAIVLVGTSSPGLNDLRPTPVGQLFTGVEVHANIVSGILEQRIKHHPQYADGIVTTILVLIAFFVTWLVPRLQAGSGALVTVGIAVVLILANHLVWQQANLVVPLAPLLLFLLFLYLFHLLYGYAIETRGKRHLSTLFGHYVPPELVEEMDRNPGRITMETESREMTVLFGDVRNFTGIAETLEPKELSRLLNEILTPMTRVVHSHRGTIDKYLGDGIMAFWGAPLRDAEHARHAVEAAMQIVAAMRELGPHFKAQGWPEIQIGIGVSSGEMRVGNMGSEFRVAYTVLGDAVNLGARLEGLTKQYDVSIAVAETTRGAISDYGFLELDRVRVKGREQPVAVFEPIGPMDELEPSQRAMLRQCANALQSYRSADWDAAEQAFFTLRQLYPDRRIFRVYLDRIAQYRSKPPDTDWSGVFKVLTK